MPRPSVDVVIPFAGSTTQFDELLARVDSIDLDERDRLLVVDNRPERSSLATSEIDVVAAPEVSSSYYARNRGAERGDAPWIVFLDADVEWHPRLLEAYFDPPPGDGTAVLGGEIVDAPLDAADSPSVAERYAVERRTMSAANTLKAEGRPAYAQTANCAIRRQAFEAVGGFASEIRSGGDADLCFRLAAAGWQLELRPAAVVVHRNRRTLSALLAQKARHGAGAAWLERQHPGTFPRRRLSGLALWSVRRAFGATGSSGRDIRTELVDVAAVWAFELGRLRSNRARRTTIQGG